MGVNMTVAHKGSISMGLVLMETLQKSLDLTKFGNLSGTA